MINQIFSQVLNVGVNCFTADRLV